MKAYILNKIKHTKLQAWWKHVLFINILFVLKSFIMHTKSRDGPKQYLLQHEDIKPTMKLREHSLILDQVINDHL